MNHETVNVSILDSNYSFKCPQEDVELLMQSAKFLNQVMRKIQAQHINPRGDIAVMAALNIASLLIKERRKGENGPQDLGLETKLSKVQDQLRLLLDDV
jgi:cell division protein ZapA (FtsZ GTPase activity inhibitor)